MGLLPEDVSPDKLDSDPELAQKVSDGLVDSEALASLGVALKHYDKVAAAVAEFDAKSTGDEACFTMDLSKPMGLRLDDDTLVVLGVSPGGQAEEAQVPLVNALEKSSGILLLFSFFSTGVCQPLL